jgi:hypothetical protein
MKYTYTLLMEYYCLQFVPILNNIASSSGACRQIDKRYQEGLCKSDNQTPQHHI